MTCVTHVTYIRYEENEGAPSTFPRGMLNMKQGNYERKEHIDNIPHLLRREVEIAPKGFDMVTKRKSTLQGVKDNKGKWAISVNISDATYAVM